MAYTRKRRALRAHGVPGNDHAGSAIDPEFNKLSAITQLRRLRYGVSENNPWDGHEQAAASWRERSKRRLAYFALRLAKKLVAQ